MTGSEAEPVSRRQVEREWSDIAFALKFYVVLLAIQIATAITAHATTPLHAYIVADGALGAANVIALAMRWRLVRDSLRLGFPPRLALVALGGALPVFVSVHFVVYGIALAFSIFDKGYLADFRGVHVAWAYVIIAVDAAVLEEVAFRGVIYTILRKYLGLSEAIIVTSFAFAIMHFSVLGLVTHVALGIYLCWFREKSGSVVPGIAAHFLHNALVLLDEQFYVLPRALIPGWP